MKRNEEIDIIKGFLVLLMIFFHCASMAKDIYPDLRIVLKILDWLHYGFILMSGFLCGWYYLPKLKTDKRIVKNRIKIRGVKLVVLFVVINLFLYSSQFMVYFNQEKSYLRNIPLLHNNQSFMPSVGLDANEVLLHKNS